MMEEILEQQLKQVSLSVDECPQNQEQWSRFLDLVNLSYHTSREAAEFLDNALKQSTKEMTDLNQQLLVEAEERISAVKESEEKSRFMENMSHELRTPLHGILGSLEIVKDNTNLDNNQKTFISAALMSGENLLDIVNNILDFSKIRANELELEEISFNIRELFNDVGHMLDVAAGDKKIHHVINVEEEVPYRIKGDPSKVRQVMMNLASNAAKFTEEGTILSDISLLGANTCQTTLRIGFTDTGIGIPTSKVDQIFRAFTQADVSTTRKYEGVGLGLTISKDLVHLMGGTINLESVEGQGSHFWVDIPFTTVDFHNGDVVTTSSDLSGLKVLIVEKDRRNLNIFDHYFSDWKVIYKYVDSSREAINSLFQARDALAPFDVVLVDYFMPGMDSLELSETLNSNPDFKRIPRVVLSSYDLAKEEREIANIEICLTKPIRENMLKDVLLECLNIKNKYIHDESTHSLRNKNISLKVLDMSESSTPAREADILLAEDNPVNALIAVTMVEQIGLTVKHVTDGQKALDEVKAGNYRLILMDMHMPIMDGYKSTRNIRQWEEERGIEPTPIIALTANALAGDREKCLVAGVDDYLPKPVKQVRLREVVTKWTEAMAAV